MSYWDKYRNRHEPKEHWEMRKRFFEAHKDTFDEDRLLCLAQTFYNVEFLGCKYPEIVMKQIEELSKGIADDHRDAKKTKIQRTFVQASEAAESKVCRREIKRKHEENAGEDSGMSSGIQGQTIHQVLLNQNRPAPKNTASGLDFRLIEKYLDRNPPLSQLILLRMKNESSLTFDYLQRSTRISHVKALFHYRRLDKQIEARLSIAQKNQQMPNEVAVATMAAAGSGSFISKTNKQILKTKMLESADQALHAGQFCVVINNRFYSSQDHVEREDDEEESKEEESKEEDIEEEKRAKEELVKIVEKKKEEDNEKKKYISDEYEKLTENNIVNKVETADLAHLVEPSANLSKYNQKDKELQTKVCGMADPILKDNFVIVINTDFYSSREIVERTIDANISQKFINELRKGAYKRLKTDDEERSEGVDGNRWENEDVEDESQIEMENETDGDEVEIPENKYSYEIVGNNVKEKQRNGDDPNSSNKVKVEGTCGGNDPVKDETKELGVDVKEERAEVNLEEINKAEKDSSISGYPNTHVKDENMEIQKDEHDTEIVNGPNVTDYTKVGGTSEKVINVKVEDMDKPKDEGSKEMVNSPNIQCSSRTIVGGTSDYVIPKDDSTEIVDDPNIPFSSRTKVGVPLAIVSDPNISTDIRVEAKESVEEASSSKAGWRGQWKGRGQKKEPRWAKPKWGPGWKRSLTKPKWMDYRKKRVEKNKYISDDFEKIAEDNPGSKLLRLMGWSGGGLGKTGQGIAEPVPITGRMDNKRPGLGKEEYAAIPKKIRGRREGPHKVLQGEDGEATMGLSVNRQDGLKGEQFKSWAHELLTEYLHSPNLLWFEDLIFAPTFTREERAVFHILVQKNKLYRDSLTCKSYGKDEARQMIIGRKAAQNGRMILRDLILCGDNPKFSLIVPEKFYAWCEENGYNAG